jgi:hypothetical protein
MTQARLDETGLRHRCGFCVLSGHLPVREALRADDGLVALTVGLFTLGAMGEIEGGIMDFSARLDELERHVAAARSAVQVPATESREQLRRGIDQTQDDLDQAVKNAQQAAAGARSKWAQMMADAAAKRDDVKAKIDRRGRQLDANAAADEASWAEADAADALDFAEWAIDNAKLAMLDAIDARAYSDERAKAAGS